MKKILYSILGLAAILLVIGFVVTTFFPEKLVPFMLNQQLQRQMALVEKNNEILEDQESIRVYTVGTASPMPGERVQTGTGVIVNGHFFMFDVGDGVVQKAENMGLPLNRLDGIFITHWHSDHMMDLPSLISRSWLLGRTKDLHLYGPDGTDTLNQAINQFLHIENRHRLDHHGHETMDISKARAIAHEFKNVQGGKEVIYQQDGITITAFDVDHSPIEPAVGYAIEYNGKKVVISGDTKKNDLVLEMAENADLLLHEVILNSLLKQMEPRLKQFGMTRNRKIVHDIQDYHTPPSEVAEIASKANVKKLVLHHFAPPPDFRVVKNLYQKELSGYDGEIHFSNDGDVFVIE
ncbi:MAG: MBL fold metallo-hydrolase [Bacteroidetes bacterium]|jgi:ribonuclease Z|nr:MBL fold metallo-hydrolase [Bacteroidota bacterium]MDF1863643.1 MBL fold metallo-hydrolase [Saprospiraceae bacterium]